MKIQQKSFTQLSTEYEWKTIVDKKGFKAEDSQLVFAFGYGEFLASEKTFLK